MINRTPSSLEQVETVRKAPLDEVIPSLLSTHQGNVFEVALELSVLPNVIYQWLGTHGYRRTQAGWLRVNADRRA